MSVPCTHLVAMLGHPQTHVCTHLTPRVTGHPHSLTLHLPCCPHGRNISASVSWTYLVRAWDTCVTVSSTHVTIPTAEGDTGLSTCLHPSPTCCVQRGHPVPTSCTPLPSWGHPLPSKPRNSWSGARSALDGMGWWDGSHGMGVWGCRLGGTYQSGGREGPLGAGDAGTAFGAVGLGLEGRDGRGSVAWSGESSPPWPPPSPSGPSPSRRPPSCSVSS